MPCKRRCAERKAGVTCCTIFAVKNETPPDPAIFRSFFPQGSRYENLLCSAIAIAMLAMSPALRAQTCYTPVTQWTGAYALSGSAETGPCPGFEGAGSVCTISQSVATKMTMMPNFVSCSEAEWADLSDDITTFSVNNMGSYPCSENQTETVTIVGTAGGLGASYLTVFPSGGTYTFSPVDFGNATLTEQGCDTRVVTLPRFPARLGHLTLLLLPSNQERSFLTIPRPTGSSPSRSIPATTGITTALHPGSSAPPLAAKTRAWVKMFP